MSKGELHLAMGSLTEIEQQVLREFYGFGQTPSSDRLIGERLCWNDQKVQYVRQGALVKLRTILEGTDDGR